MDKLSFVSLLCYDYDYLLKSLKTYYSIADEIILGLDSNLKTYTGNSFEIPQSFYDDLNILDVDSKITIVKGNFVVRPEPMVNETYERNFLSQYCMPNSWVIQIDSDEYITEPEKLRAEILAVKDTNARLSIAWKTIFKSFDSGYLVIYPEKESTNIATCLRNSYICARTTNQPEIRLSGYMLHNSWGRKDEELYNKLKNWSHAKDFDTDKYFEFWKGITLENYKEVRNFHPLSPEVWPELKFIPKEV